MKWVLKPQYCASYWFKLILSAAASQADDEFVCHMLHTHFEIGDQKILFHESDICKNEISNFVFSHN